MRYAVAIALLLIGCPKDKQDNSITTDAPKGEQETFRIVESTLADGMILQEVDLDADTRPDVFNTFQPRAGAHRLLVRKEIDLNFDGKLDQITYFNEEGQIEREEIDRDFDGHFDWTDHYQDDVRVMSEVDTDVDGKMDVFTYYEGDPPKITRKDRDTNGDSLIDVWEKFDENGVVNRTGRDIDGDGKMDEREE